MNEILFLHKLHLMLSNTIQLRSDTKQIWCSTQNIVHRFRERNHHFRSHGTREVKHKATCYYALKTNILNGTFLSIEPIPVMHFVS